MKITCSKHFTERNKLRNIDVSIAERIFHERDAGYLDTETQKLVAVKRLDYKGKTRDVCLVYAEGVDEIIFITIHPLKEGQKQNRIITGRWIPL